MPNRGFAAITEKVKNTPILTVSFRSRSVRIGPACRRTAEIIAEINAIGKTNDAITVIQGLKA